MASHRLDIHVRASGLLTTVQDLGRLGYAHLGFSPCGAADQIGARIANRLVGNSDGTPVLEWTFLGPTLEFSEDAVVAIAGASTQCSLDGHSIPTWQSIDLSSGSVLRLGATVPSARCYLAIAGLPQPEPVLGSFSTDLGAKVGPFCARKLATGDILTWHSPDRAVAHMADREVLSQLYAEGPFRITPGPHRGWFALHVEEQFFNSKYLVTPQSNRSALRLHGEPLPLQSDEPLLSEGVPLGAVQIPADGQPIILMMDQQTTGGYPVIGSVISADLHRMAQLLPHAEIAFTRISIEQALSERRHLEGLLQKALG